MENCTVGDWRRLIPLLLWEIHAAQEVLEAPDRSAMCSKEEFQAELRVALVLNGIDVGLAELSRSLRVLSTYLECY
jgi:hypothetical protein